MAITAAQLQAAFKAYYAGQAIQNLTFGKKSRPFLNALMATRDEGFEGDDYPVPVVYEDVGGGSNTFATAQANAAAPALATFHADVAKYYRVVQIETVALRKAKSDKGSFLRTQFLKTDSALNALANDLEKSLFRKSSGALGVIDATTTITSTSIVLTNVADAKNFAVNDVLVAAANVTSSLRSATGNRVAAVNKITGTLTMDTEGDNGSPDLGWVVGDSLFRMGDYVSSSDTLHLNGLQDFIPDTVASNDSFQGVNRFPDRQRLAGTVYAGSLTDIEYSIYQCLSQMADQSEAEPDTLFCNNDLAALLAKELNLNVQRNPQDGKAGMGPMTILGPRGPLSVQPATFCPPNMAFVLPMDAMKLISLGMTVGIFDDDGTPLLRQTAADAVEVRAVSYPQLTCSRPAHLGKINFT
jgi:hypothetical protein